MRGTSGGDARLSRCREPAGIPSPQWRGWVLQYTAPSRHHALTPSPLSAPAVTDGSQVPVPREGSCSFWCGNCCPRALGGSAESESDDYNPSWTLGAPKFGNPQGMMA